MDMVSVTAFGNLKDCWGKEMAVPTGQTVAQAIESLRLGKAGGLPLTAVVNGQVVPWDYVLKSGDKMLLIPTIGGG
jgi:sulfur carrier protein ThiS